MNDGKWPEGKYLDQLTRKGDALLDTGWHSNIVVDRGRQLLAAFMKGDAAASGIHWLAVGRGDSAWDTQPVAPLASSEQLVDPEPVILPVDPKCISYLDAAGQPSAGPTARLQIVVTLQPGTPAPQAGGTYPLREFALFGGFGGARYMIDYVRHPVVHKAAADTLVRTIRLTF